MRTRTTPTWPTYLATMPEWLLARGIRTTPGQQLAPDVYGQATAAWHEERAAWATAHGCRVQSDGTLVVDPVLGLFFPAP